MVEKEVKEINSEYYSVGAVEKKFNPLFSSAKTRDSKDIDMSKNCKKITEKKEKRKCKFTAFDAPKEEY